MKQKLFKPFVLIGALTFAGFFASSVADANNPQGDRYFWVYNCPGGDFEFFEYKSPEKGARGARKLCEKHARHEKKYKNAGCLTCTQVTTADGKTPAAGANAQTEK